MNNLTVDQFVTGLATERDHVRPDDRAPRGSIRLLRGLRPRRARTAPAAGAMPLGTGSPDTASPGVRGFLRLTLHDGVARLYLLDHRDFAATTSPEVAYDARVHAAYLLSLQGHRPEWLAGHLDLPTAAALSIAEHAESSGPAGPGMPPPSA